MKKLRNRFVFMEYPDVVLDITTDYAFTDIVKDRFDIGIRMGSAVDKDMVAVRVTPDFQMIVVASPEYIVAHGVPETPKDLSGHRCLTMRLPRHENIMNWEFQSSGKNQSVVSYRPQSAMVVSHAHLLMRDAIGGLGLAWVPATMAEQELKRGVLTEVLADWKMTYEGYYMYYPNRNLPPLFRLFVDAVKLKVS